MNKPRTGMKVEIEFKSGSVNVSQISAKISQILNSVKQQGFDAKEFSIEMDIGLNGGVIYFQQNISSVFDSINQQGLNAKELELKLAQDQQVMYLSLCKKYLQ